MLTSELRKLQPAARTVSLPLAAMRPCHMAIALPSLLARAGTDRAHSAGPCRGDPCTAGRQGFVHRMRETGADDDDWSPATLVLPLSPEHGPAPVTAEMYAAVDHIQAETDCRPRAPPSQPLSRCRSAA